VPGESRYTTTRDLTSTGIFCLTAMTMCGRVWMLIWPQMSGCQLAESWLTGAFTGAHPVNRPFAFFLASWQGLLFGSIEGIQQKTPRRGAEASSGVTTGRRELRPAARQSGFLPVERNQIWLSPVETG
jgi:hypothetical protein